MRSGIALIVEHLFVIGNYQSPYSNLHTTKDGLNASNVTFCSNAPAAPISASGGLLLS